MQYMRECDAIYAMERCHIRDGTMPYTRWNDAIFARGHREEMSAIRLRVCVKNCKSETVMQQKFSCRSFPLFFTKKKMNHINMGAKVS